MQIFYSIFIFCFGLCVGSFLNVVICRLPKGEKISGRSYCPHCKKTIAWYDLIPVFSFLVLSGKCRYCHKRISPQYPLVEIFTGILFLLVTYNLQLATYNLESLIQLVYWLFVVSCLVAISVIDLKHYIIPAGIVLPAIGIVFLYRLFEILNLEFVSDFGFRISDFQLLLNPLLSAFLFSLFFLGIVIISRGKWMGMGDVKLAGLLGLILGWPKILPALFLSFLLGGIIGIGLIMFGKKNLKSEMPLGPFLATGTIIAIFWGQNLINWYLGLL